MFRTLESAALVEALTEPNTVIACGGGIVLSADNRAALRASHRPVIYLKADAETLHTRIHADAATAASRPPLTALGGSLEEVRSLLEKRDPLYRDVATAIVEVSHKSADTITAEIDTLKSTTDEHR